MSSRNKHKKSTWCNEVNNKKCPKKGCSGRLIHCQSQYRPQGPINEELECSDCSLVKKDQRFTKWGRDKFKRAHVQPSRPDRQIRFAPRKLDA